LRRIPDLGCLYVAGLRECSLSAIPDMNQVDEVKQLRVQEHNDY
jgi:hypothetical protein